ncbi:MAG: hypothetical protein V2A73_06615 [Pseudomonadota bacterium]
MFSKAIAIAALAISTIVPIGCSPYCQRNSDCNLGEICGPEGVCQNQPDAAIIDSAPDGCDIDGQSDAGMDSLVDGLGDAKPSSDGGAVDAIAEPSDGAPIDARDS